MPSQSPTGLIGVSIVALARLLAASTAFRTLVGAASADEALPFIYYLEASDAVVSGVTPPRLIEPRPRAIIANTGKLTTSRIGSGGWREEGDLLLSLELPIPAAYLGDWREEALWAGNTVGAIWKDVQDNSGGSDGTNPYLNVTMIDWDQELAPCEPSQGTEYFWGCTLRCSYVG